jgi:type VI secretion system protein ImpE
MTAQDYLKRAQPEQALAALQETVDRQATKVPERVLLFEILCILGQWERAMTQLRILAKLDKSCDLLARVFLPVLGIEPFRAAVFEGKAQPLIFGEPPEWVALLVQSNQMLAEAHPETARDLMAKAMTNAPRVAGAVNGQPFQWIADGDARFGPVLEVILEGRYYWVPIHRIRQITVRPPVHLRDWVWTAARFTWTNGGQAAGYIPTRYPGTEATPDGTLQLAGRTDWVEKAAGIRIGAGARVLITDTAELALLEIRQLDLDNHG